MGPISPHTKNTEVFTLDSRPPSLEQLSKLENPTHPVQESDRLKEFMNEPIISQSRPAEPISPGGLGYERTESSTSYESSLTASQPHIDRGLRPVDSMNKSFLSVPISPIDIDDQSDLDSIASASSDENNPRAPSSQSSINTNTRFNDAVASFVSMLTTDKFLKPLYREAIGVMSSDRFERNFARLLKRYAKHLHRGATDQTEIAIAMFVRRSALDAATAVTRHFFPNREGETLLHELVTLPLQQAVLVENCLSRIDEDIADNVSTGNEDASFVDGDLGDNLPEDDESITRFMVRGKAFECLRGNLKAFLDPAESIYDCDGLQKNPSGATEELEDPGISRALTRRATQAWQDDEGFLLDFDDPSGSRTSTGLSETNSDFVIFILFFHLWDLLKKYYILSLQYLLSLVPPRDLDRHSKNQSSWAVIYLYNANGEASEATVKLDTGSDLNVISLQKLSELGKESEIQRFNRNVFEGVRTVNGVTFQPRGSLELRWSRQKTSKIFKERFFVFDDCPEDVLFGNPYIKKLRLVRYDWRSVLLDVWVTKPKQTDADRAAEKRRQNEKAALAERRRLASMPQTAIVVST
ncbi:uncharacterized protein PAC_04871 [Phialocephala subalpina]|uniref:Uncharacterized protein n=1 Tax=Phialocephala subalpina TaxID=576137 RepID=A0A1L7WQE5_9HELO|nr:uncharacterized protein PAC_04871 [Phialocephala subalpina]